MRSLFLIILLAGCAASQQAGRGEEELARELAGRVAGQAQRCIPTMTNQGLTIADRRTVVRRDGPTLWVNQLEQHCSGFEPLNTLVVQVHGAQHCRGDQVRALEPGSTIPGPICRLGDFVPYRAPG